MDLLVPLDRSPAAPPLRQQLESRLRDAVRTGALRPDVGLPPTRTLAGELGVSRGVVVGVYEQLVAEGYLVARRGDGTRVATGVRTTATTTTASAATAATTADGHANGHPHASQATTPRWDLTPSLPDLSAFPRGAWLKATAKALRTAPDAALGYGDPRGAEPLRHALADYLGRVRGVVADPENIIVTVGSRQAVWLCLDALADRGARRVAHESPGWRGQVHAAEDAGLTPVPAPVDAFGLDPSGLDADAVCLSPAHQFPTGVVLAPERRAALIAHARAHGTLLVEDDYDAEFRYDREPVGALQGLAPDLVAYTGTAAKTLAPGLRLAWVVAPAALAVAMAERKARADRGSPVLEQLALAELIATGELDRHLRRVRLRYRRRRDAMTRALADQLPHARVEGVAAGLHVLVRLPDGDEDALVAGAHAAGIRVEGLRRHGGDPGAPPGLLVGYANVPEPAAPAAAAALARALARTIGP